MEQMEQNLIVLGLQHLGRLLDRLVPMQGGRTVLIGVLTVIGNIALFVTGKVSSAEASSNIAVGFGVIFAALHKPPS